MGASPRRRFTISGVVHANAVAAPAPHRARAALDAPGVGRDPAVTRELERRPVAHEEHVDQLGPGVALQKERGSRAPHDDALEGHAPVATDLEAHRALEAHALELELTVALDDDGGPGRESARPRSQKRAPVVGSAAKGLAPVVAPERGRERRERGAFREKLTRVHVRAGQLAQRAGQKSPPRDEEGDRYG